MQKSEESRLALLLAGTVSLYPNPTFPAWAEEFPGVLSFLLRPRFRQTKLHKP